MCNAGWTSSRRSGSQAGSAGNGHHVASAGDGGGHAGTFVGKVPVDPLPRTAIVTNIDVLARLDDVLATWAAHPASGPVSPTVTDDGVSVQVTACQQRLLARPGAVVDPDSGATAVLDPAVRTLLLAVARTVADLGDVVTVAVDDDRCPTATVARLLQLRWAAATSPARATPAAA